MALSSQLWLLGLMFATARAARDTRSSDIAPRSLQQDEKAAQALVASLLRERNGGASASFSSKGIMQWVPSSSLEGQQAHMSQEDAEHELRAEFEDVLGKDLVKVFENDFESIKQELQSLYMTIPKNEYGELEHTGVRYALHRLFVARHGWYIQGIDPEGDHYNESSPVDVLKGHVPGHVQRFIEKLLYGRGFGLSEVALLGALLENLIHKEAIQRAATVFEKSGTDIHQKMSPEVVDYHIDLYMAAYIMGQDVGKISTTELLNLYQGMSTAYPGWEETRRFTHKIREDKIGNRDLTFNDTVAVLNDIGEKHGTWQQRECLDLKKQLVDLEESKNGCVPVARFYKGMKDQGKWQFSESPDYLRELGALDESDPQNLKVMIPNYIDGLSNCVASSSYYSVCCINECDGILARIEKHFQAPDASPEELAPLIMALPSSTVPAGRKLSTSLMQHLGKIAFVHGGRVPFHSRLFMQWMHNAYPHECPYPHISGKTAPRTPDIWMAETHKDPTVTDVQINNFIDAAQKAGIHKTGQCGQWLDEEELYVPWHTNPLKVQAENEAHVWAGASSISLLAAVASMIVMLIHTIRSVRASSQSRKPKMIVT